MTKRGRYPNWVKNQVPEGHEARREKDDYVLYRLVKDTDDEGKTTEVAIRVGIICPEGIKSDTPLTFINMVMFEYGFSKACFDLCPDRWKKVHGSAWRDMLLVVISAWSKHSYALADKIVADSTNAKLQSMRFNIFLQETGVSLDELWQTLHEVSMVYFPDRDERYLTTPTKEQLLFCQAHKIELEVK